MHVILPPCLRQQAGCHVAGSLIPAGLGWKSDLGQEESFFNWFLFTKPQVCGFLYIAAERWLKATTILEDEEIGTSSCIWASTP